MSNAIANGTYPVDPEEGNNDTSAEQNTRRASAYDQRPSLYSHYSSSNTVHSTSSASTLDQAAQRMEGSTNDQQRSAQSGPVRHKPAPLNLQVPGSTMSDPNMSAISTDMKSPYAGSYMQRQGYRPAQHPNGNLNGTGRPGAEDADSSAGLQYPGYPSGHGEDHSGNPASGPRPSGLSHSSSLPLLPTSSNFSGQPYTAGESGMVTPTYPPYPGMYSRTYSYPSPGMAVDNGSSSYSSGMNGPPSSASTGGHLPLPPPFNHSYSSPSVPLYPPPLSHYSSYPPSGYAGNHYSTSGYMVSPTSANPSAGSNYSGTPGVLMINSSGQVIPHNPGSLVGGRGVPLSERPFKCDECIQSFNRNHDLKRHKRIHLAVKPFACEKCGKQFSRKDALRRHWLVKGCRSSDDPNVNMHNPAYNANPPSLSPPTPEVAEVRGTASQDTEAINATGHTANTGAHGSLLRTPSYAGPLVVTPDEQDSFSAGGSQYYQQYGRGGTSIGQQPQISPGVPRSQMNLDLPLKSASVSDNTTRSLASPSDPYAPLSSAGLQTYASNTSQSKPELAPPAPSQNGAENKLPGRYSFDARTGLMEGGNEDDRVESQRSYSMSNASGHRVEGNETNEQRGNRADYFTGVFPDKNGPPSTSEEQAADGNRPKPDSSMSLDEAPTFTAPFDRERAIQQSGSDGQGGETYPRWHRPSFPFPATQAESLYQRPDTVNSSTDLRKTVTRAHISQSGGMSQTSPIQRGWTRASFPFPENPDNAMGLKDEVRQGA